MGKRSSHALALLLELFSPHFQVLASSAGYAGPVCQLRRLPVLLLLQRETWLPAVYPDAPRLLSPQGHVAVHSQGGVLLLLSLLRESVVLGLGAVRGTHSCTHAVGWCL